MNRREIITALQDSDPAALFAKADSLRKEHVGDQVHLRAVIEFSNYCGRQCFYCGLRRSNFSLPRYRMTESEIFAAAKRAAELGYKTLVLQSGEDEGYPTQEIVSVVRKIKNELNMAITLCCGERSRHEYRMFKDAGADRYLLKLETSDRELFKQLKPDSSFENRVRCLEWLIELGFQVGSGNIVGLPGQTLKSLADDILLFKELNLDMVGIGPFIPHPGTPIGLAQPGALDLSLRVVALTRILTLNAHIPATTASGTIDPQGRQKALAVGANVLMPNVTPTKYRPLYEIYPNKICVNDGPAECRNCMSAMLASLGRTVADDHGHSLKDRS